MKKGLYLLLLIVAIKSFSQDLYKEFTISEPKKIYNLINSSAEEDLPLLSHSGDVLYFVRTFHPQNTGGKYAGQDIWMSRKINDSTWSSPINHFPIEGNEFLNDEYNNVVVGVSYTGDTLYLLNHYHHHKRKLKHNHHYKKTEEGLSITYRGGDGIWSAPKDINMPVLDFDIYHYGLSMNHTGDVLLISVEYPEHTLGKEDLYVVLKKGENNWTDPIHLGNVVNTEFIEFSPFLSQDKNHLYFASNRPGGYGGVDIYETERLDSTWTKWSEPVNMGPKINTAGFDAYLSISDDHHLLFARNLDTLTADIYIADITQKKAPLFDENNETILANIIDSSGFLNLEYLVNVDTIVQVKDVLDPNMKVAKGINIDSLIYEKALDYVDDMNKKKGYEVVDLHDTEVRDLSKKDLQGNKILPRAITIHFDFNLATLGKEDEELLDKAIFLLKNDNKLKATLTGHTCTIGPDHYNRDLSKQRAISARSFLLKKKVSNHALFLKWQGELKPVAANDTEEGRATNRRVEISFSR